MNDDDEMRAAFWAWVDEQGCDTDGAWSAWAACWHLRSNLVATKAAGSDPEIDAWHAAMEEGANKAMGARKTTTKS